MEDGDFEARYYAALDAMAPEAREACIEVMDWIAFERPLDTEFPSAEEFNKLVEDVMERRWRERNATPAAVLPFVRKA